MSTRYECHAADYVDVTLLSAGESYGEDSVPAGRSALVIGAAIDDRFTVVQGTPAELLALAGQILAIVQAAR